MGRPADDRLGLGEIELSEREGHDYEEVCRFMLHFYVACFMLHFCCILSFIEVCLFYVAFFPLGKSI